MSYYILDTPTEKGFWVVDDPSLIGVEVKEVSKEEFQDFVDKHNLDLFNEVIVEPEPEQPIHADPEKDKLIRKFIRHYDENPNNVHSKFQEIDLLDIMYCLDIEGDDRLTKKREVELIVEELTRRNIIVP